MEDQKLKIVDITLCDKEVDTLNFLMQSTGKSRQVVILMAMWHLGNAITGDKDKDARLVRKFEEAVLRGES